MDELLQIFDRERCPIGAMPRSIVKTEPRQYLYGAANVWLVNASGQILCSRRAAWLSSNPGKWQTYFGGHLKEGQSFLAAAKAELAEEAGIEIEVNQLVLIETGLREEYKMFFENYAYSFDGCPEDLVFIDEETIAAKWMTIDEAGEARKTHPDEWCNGVSSAAKHVLEDWICHGRQVRSL